MRRLPLKRIAEAALIILLCVSVRLTGIRHGAPDLIFHPDVAKQVFVARDVYAGVHRPELNRYVDNYAQALYPYGASVLLAQKLKMLSPFLRAAGWDREQLLNMHRWSWAFLLRLNSVFWITLALAVFIMRAWPALSWKTRLPAALLLIFEPVNAQYSHYGMNDVPLAALLMLAWLAAAAIDRDTGCRPWRSALCGLILGVAFGVKYQALLGILLPVTVWILLFREKNAGWRWAVPVAVATGFLAGALYACPPLRIPDYFMKHFPRFMAWQANITGEEISLMGKISRNAALLVRFSFRYGYWLLLPPWVLLMLRAARKKLDRNTLLMAVPGFVFSTFLLFLFIVSRDFIRSNDLVALAPFWIWPVALIKSPERRGPRIVFRAILTALVMAWISAAWFDSLALRRTDTRIRARDWCVEHFHSRQTAIFERYTLRTRKPRVHEVQVRNLVSRQARRHMRRGQYQWLVQSSIASDRFYDPLSPYFDRQAQRDYLDIETSHVVMAEFRDRELFFAHPRIRIYTPAP